MIDLPSNVLRYGTDAPLPEQIALRAGPLSMVYEDGDLRYIRFSEHEVVRGIYAAVRDHNWGTVPGILSNVQIDRGDDRFRIAYDSTHRHNNIDFVWHGTIEGSGDGTITFTFDGVARSTFRRNRIGFCVLHPAACAGAACVVEHMDGLREQAMLPTLIVADQPLLPFGDMRALEHQVAPGVWASVRFTGDVFEMEDQRNWTDASFKTFCTPLRLPYPVEIAAGTRVHQAITLTLRTEPHVTMAQSPQFVAPASGAQPVTISVTGSVQPLLGVGLGVASHDEPLSERAVNRLGALNLAHLRVDLIAAAPDVGERLRRAGGEAQQLNVPLKVALLLPDDPDAALEHLREQIEQVRPAVSRWLIYPAMERFKGGAPVERLVRAARKHLAGYNPAAQFSAGTNADYIFLRRNLPPVEEIDVLACAINPQVHAFDNASLVETLAAQATVVGSMRALAPGVPVVVSPVTLKPRFNAYASGPEPRHAPGELPPQVDVRQLSLFGAAWTLGSLKYLAESGVASATFYETTGWRGVLETDNGSPLPDRFRSLPGAVFPLYHVLADAGAFAGGDVVATRSSDSLAVESLLLRNADRTRLLVANMTNTEQWVRLPHLGEHARRRVLDETNAVAAMQQPQAWRQHMEQITGGELERFVLPPYAVACIDTDGGPR
jgi:hypothetical protein